MQSAQNINCVVEGSDENNLTMRFIAKIQIPSEIYPRKKKTKIMYLPIDTGKKKDILFT